MLGFPPENQHLLGWSVVISYTWPCLLLRENTLGKYFSIQNEIHNNNDGK